VYSKLFEPLKIGIYTALNRIVMPPMVVGYAGPRGEVTEQLISYYEARAKGGAGLIIVEASYVREDGRLVLGELGIYDDSLIPGLARLADAIKVHGALAVVQIAHGGIQAGVPEPVGPSSIARRMIPPAKTPRELSTEEVERLVEDFVRAALRAKQAGFDGVEVHGTHGYLVNQFLSPLTNRRTDKYGADRALFAVEVVERIKQLCGRDFLVLFRLNASEFLPGGIDVEYAKSLAKRLEDVGIDAFDVTAGNYDTIDVIIPPYFYAGSEGWFLHLSRQVKEVVGVPVISGGLLTTPEVAEKAISEGYCDAVFIGRQLIADPEWPRKVREGRTGEIRLCIACNECIGTRLFAYKPLLCTVNPLTGYEYRWASDEYLPKAPTRRRVLVVGGGPAGLEVARVAAIRGHEVVLVEEDPTLGGTAEVASAARFLTGNKRRVAKLIEWYKSQLEKLGVKLVLGTRVTPELVEEVKPDVVVIATGSSPLIPRIPSVENVVVADDVLLGRVSVGGKVVVVGGGLVGIETALHLASQGKDVTVVEALPEIARDVEAISRIALVRPGGLLEKHKVKVLTNAVVVEVRRNGVEVVIPPLERRFIEADTVVLAVGRSPRLDWGLIEAAKRVAKEVYVIGDARKPRKMIDAVHEGFFTALAI